MSTSFDLRTEDTKRSLSETIAWCAGLHLTGSFEYPDGLKQRLSLSRQASDLRLRAWVRNEHFWNRIFRRDYRTSDEWRLSEELLRQAASIPIDLPLKGQLRSGKLEPFAPMGKVQNEEDRQHLVHSVVTRRSELLRTSGRSAVPAVGDELCGGRLLLYSPSENVADGASAVASGGFFDLYDAPPWDTWVGYSDGGLLSWAPPQVVTLVQSGIDVNPVGSIRWLN